MDPDSNCFAFSEESINKLIGPHMREECQMDKFKFYHERVKNNIDVSESDGTGALTRTRTHYRLVPSYQFGLGLGRSWMIHDHASVNQMC
jgi:hypothetical protein